MPKKNHNQKGQAAMDLLLTYGWVLVVIIGIISVLTFSGIFDIGFLSGGNECTSNHPIHCDSLRATTHNDGITLDVVFSNIGAKTIDITSISFSDPNDNTCTINGLNKIIKSGEKGQIIANCENEEIKNSKNGKVTISFLDDTALSKTQILQVSKGEYQLSKVNDDTKPTISLTKGGKTYNYKVNDNTTPISETNPVLIMTPTDLHNIRYTIEPLPSYSSFTHFELQNDIDLSDFDSDTDSSNGNFESIGGTSGNVGTFFRRANFDGNGYTIYNLNINVSADRQGLFGGVNNANISNVFVSGSVEGNNYVGGVVGYLTGNGVSNSSFSGNIKGTARVGGLIGSVNNGNVDGSSFHGNVTGDSSRVGGLIGQAVFSKAIINSSFASGTINVKQDFTGGLIGDLGSKSKVSSSFAYVEITGSHGKGLVGLLSPSASCSDSYWDTQVSKTKESACGTGKTTSELQTPTSNTGIYSNWDTNIWDFGTATEYPKLK